MFVETSKHKDCHVVLFGFARSKATGLLKINSLVFLFVGPGSCDGARWVRSNLFFPFSYAGIDYARLSRLHTRPVPRLWDLALGHPTFAIPGVYEVRRLRQTRFTIYHQRQLVPPALQQTLANRFLSKPNQQQPMLVESKEGPEGFEKARERRTRRERTAGLDEPRCKRALS